MGSRDGLWSSLSPDSGELSLGTRSSVVVQVQFGGSFLGAAGFGSTNADCLVLLLQSRVLPDALLICY
jgi:hypothetical protein